MSTRRELLPIYVTPDAQLKYLKPGAGSFDADLIQIAEQYIDETSCVWDIGANIGVFSFAAASMATKGRVLAVELDIWLAGIIKDTAALDDWADREIAVLPSAISDRNSVASFLVAARGRASNALESFGGRSQMGGVRETQYVPTLTLDTLLESFPAPDSMAFSSVTSRLVIQLHSVVLPLLFTSKNSIRLNLTSGFEQLMRESFLRHRRM